ncbi:Probable plastid-lipid-associated protein 11 [Striga hermonthica]|uniref:Probable plastid-lipid-associated protein 11 n=1 Tax=Striga hermonthica TaxID=68872 RepID=A0A9N7NZL3_STRHE|nr:Probable plastid-lipid-associated protein 11 [Striga hermonthica]
MATNSLSLPAISNFSLPPRRFARVTRLSLSDQSQSPSVDAKRHLLRLIADQDRSLKTQSETQRLSQIVEAVDSLAATSRGSVNTRESLSDTWRMLWTTEKEKLFIVKNAPVF